MPWIKVSENGRFLVTETGEPFFWLADTAWELFNRLTREEAELYLTDRAEKGFTVIQAAVIAQFAGIAGGNAYGDTPLVDEDPTQLDEDYFAHVDWVLERAAQFGLYFALLPTWGNHWHPHDGRRGYFDENRAEAYGRSIAERYRERSNIIWVLGGDRPVETDEHSAIIRAMARGIEDGGGGRHLVTFHPHGGDGSSAHFHNDDWLDFNMRQTGHVLEHYRYNDLSADYHREPTKPVIDGEPLYEDHPIAFRSADFGHSVAADVRRHLYWSLFAGAFGHTYGHHSIWQLYDEGREPVNDPLMTWKEALDAPGARQLQFARRLLESRPFLSRIPDREVIVSDAVGTSVPGVGTRRYVATRDTDGTYAMVYVPVGRSFTVAMGKISGEKARAWWYNPRTGEATLIGEFAADGNRHFEAPQMGELLDWVLVLDDVASNYPPPGQGVLRSADAP